MRIKLQVIIFHVLTVILYPSIDKFNEFTKPLTSQPDPLGCEILH